MSETTSEASDIARKYAELIESDNESRSANVPTPMARIAGAIREVFTVEGAAKATSEDFRREIRRTFRDVWPARAAKKWKVRR